MAIQNIQEILINGKNKLFNGYIYNARYSISYGESKSILLLDLISEDGTYSVDSSSLTSTFCRSFNISIGTQINLTMHLLKVGKVVSPNGNTLQLTFVDTSQILDVTYVGLYKKFGLNSRTNLIIVGREISACDPDGDGEIITELYDPCHPCITDENTRIQRELVDCKLKDKYEIHEVKYNFSDLIQKVNSFNIKTNGAFDPNPKYLVDYTGTLREVFNQFCRDFGWFFYWNNGMVVFRDLRNTIQVNASIENFCPNLLEYNVEYSMEDTVKTATITNFSRAGDPAKLYQCTNAVYITAKTLVQGGSSYSIPLSVTNKIDSIAAGLSKYSDDLRHLYHWYVNHQMYSTNNYTKRKKIKELGITVLSSVIKLGTLASSSPPIDDVGVPSQATGLGSSITSTSPFDNVSALSSTQAANRTTILEASNENFYNCVQLLDPETQWKIVDKPNNYYFFVAEFNVELYNKYLEEEKRFAEFLNKYAVYVPDSDDKFFEDYDFELDNLCGIKYFVNTGNVSYDSLGSGAGSFQFYNTSAKGALTVISELPFAEFLTSVHDGSSTTPANSYLPFKLVVIDRGHNPFVPPAGATQAEGNPPAIRDYDLLNEVKKFIPYQIGNKNNLRGDFVPRLLEEDGLADLSEAKIGDIYVFMCHVATADDFKLTESDAYNDFASYGTLFDGKPLNKESDPELQEAEIIYQYPDLKCKIVGNNSYGGTTTLHANRVNFKTPISTFTYTEPTDALFGVIIEKTRKKRRIVEKVESFNVNNLDGNTCNYANLVVNAQNISDDRLRILTSTNDICQFSKNQIQTIHEQFSQNLAINYAQPTITKTFTIAGLILADYTPNIDNGLVSIDISLDSNNAISTTYEFSTRLMRVPAESSLIYKLKMSKPAGSYTNTTNYYPTFGQPNT